MHAFPSSCTRKQRRSSAFCMNILGRFWHFKVSYFQPVLCLFQLFCQVLFSCLLLWVCCVVRSTPRQVSTNICRNKVNPTDSTSTWQLTGGFFGRLNSHIMIILRPDTCFMELNTDSSFFLRARATNEQLRVGKTQDFTFAILHMSAQITRAV